MRVQASTFCAMGDIARCGTVRRAEKTPAVFSSAWRWIRVYMLMPPAAPRFDRELIPHLWVLAGLVVATVVLAVWPHWVVQAGYRCELQTLFGLRCPFCGMTRDFAAMLHGGRPSLNPCSWVAAVAVYGVYPVALAVAWRAGRLDVFRSEAVRRGMVVALGAMLVVNNLG
jgi:hypothetical protein